MGVGGLREGGPKASAMEEQKRPGGEREGVKLKLFRLVKPKMRVKAATSSQACSIPFSGHNLGGPRWGAGAREAVSGGWRAVGSGWGGGMALGPESGGSSVERQGLMRRYSQVLPWGLVRL